MEIRSIFQRFQMHIAALVIAGSALVMPLSGWAAETADTNDYTAQVLRAKIMEQPLVWVGPIAPSQDESKALWSICEDIRTNEATAGPGEFENYIATHPGSAWNPSLQANLAYYYRLTGRYTPALQDWQTAWEATRRFDKGPGRQVADFTLAYWAELLSSLGRVGELKQLSSESGNRQLQQRDWQESWMRSRDNMVTMEKKPGISYRCGTFALAQVAKILNPSAAPAIMDIVHTPSPTTGFSMSSLMEMAKIYKINLVAAHRDSGDDLVVPSVIHWRQNHYAAIVQERGDFFQVVDPTFGHTKWMTRDVINSEASGDFLIPADQVSEGWRPLTKAQTDSIHGKGLSNLPPPPETPPCPDAGQDPSQCANQPPCHCPSNSPPGMPSWWVSEPNIYLWMEDMPMVQKTSTGQEFSFKLYYHEAEKRPIVPTIFNFGTNWNSSWLSYVDVIDIFDNTNFQDFDATLFGSGGGQLEFVADPQDYDGGSGATFSGYPVGGGTDLQPSAVTHSTLAPILVTNVNGYVYCTGFKESYANGSQAIYGLAQFVSYAGPSHSRFFLTARIDPQGRNTQFIYSTNNNMIRLTQVYDWDGNAYTLDYDTVITNRVDEIDGPNGSVYLGYNPNSMLTNITDVVGLRSSFQYAFTASGTPELSSMLTPYGTTLFSYYQPDGSLMAEGGVNRAIEVTQPDGGLHLFLYQQWNAPSTATSTGAYTTGLTDVPVLNYASSALNFDGIYDYGMNVHNSFYWGPRQCALLSTTDISNLDSLTTTDFLYGRLQGWLEDDVSGSVSTVRSVTRMPSLDGTNPGEMTWYGYNGLTNTDYNGYYLFGPGPPAFSSTPNYIALVLPNGQTRYSYQEYNYCDYPTKNITTYSVGSTVALRTNIYIYAANNNDLVQIIGPDGVTNVSYGYNNLHQLVAETNALGEVTRYTYASYANSYSTNSQVTSISYPSGLATTNFYNSSGFLTTTYDYAVTGSGTIYYRTNSFTFANGNVYSYKDERGLIVTNTWDALNRLRCISYPDGTFITNVYTNLDVVQTVDRIGSTNSFGYDSMRRLLNWTNALGKVTAFTYCTCGALESITDPLSKQTTFYYDNQGNRTQVDYPDSYVINYNYDAVGNVTNINDSSGATYTNWYNNQGLLYAMNNNVGQMAAYTYDIDDRVTNLVNRNGVNLGIAYDKLWRPLSITYPDTGVEHWSYTAGFYGATAYANQIGNTVIYNYDPAYRKTNEVYVGVTTNFFAYDGANDLQTLTDGKNQTTTWIYDAYGNVSNKVDAASNLIFNYQYDANNRLKSRWTPAKGTTTYKYDAAGNLTNVIYPVSPAISLTYDADNRLTNMIDAVGATHYSYDTVGQLLSEGGLWPNDTVSYTYVNRLRTALTLSSLNMAYGYDTIRRLTSVTSPAGAFGYTYSGSGPSTLVARLVLPNGAYITNTFDSVARVLSTALKNSGNTVLDSEAYSYNLAGQRTQQTLTSGNYMNYTYDNMGQLITAQGYTSGSARRWQEQLGYAYDAAGNVNYRTNNGFVQTFNVNDSINELSTVTHSGVLTVAGTATTPATSVTVNTSNAILYADSTFASTNQTLTNAAVDTFTAVAHDSYGRTSSNTVSIFMPGTAKYTYDLNGNLTGEWSPAGGTNRSFIYDDENQLTSVFATNLWRCDFVYDGKLRRRIERDYAWQGGAWAQTNETHFIYDGNLVIQERNVGNNLQVSYTRGKDLSGTLQGAGGIGGLLARTDYGQEIPGSPTTAYYHADAGGNITMLIYTNQIIAAKYLYDPFGSTLSKSGPLANLNVYRFSSKEWNIGAGLYYCLYRFYVPNLQRWLNRDPIQEWGGYNLYQFVGNDPGNFVDPLGLGSISAIVGGALHPINASGSARKVYRRVPTALLDSPELTGGYQATPSWQAFPTFGLLSSLIQNYGPPYNLGPLQLDADPTKPSATIICPIGKGWSVDASTRSKWQNPFQDPLLANPSLRLDITGPDPWGGNADFFIGNNNGNGGIDGGINWGHTPGGGNLGVDVGNNNGQGGVNFLIIWKKTF